MQATNKRLSTFERKRHSLWSRKSHFCPKKCSFKFFKVNKQLQRWCQAATRAAAAARWLPGGCLVAALWLPSGCLAGRLVDRLAGPVPKKITWKLIRFKSTFSIFKLPNFSSFSQTHCFSKLGFKSCLFQFVDRNNLCQFFISLGFWYLLLGITLDNRK